MRYQSMGRMPKGTQITIQIEYFLYPRLFPVPKSESTSDGIHVYVYTCTRTDGTWRYNSNFVLARITSRQVSSQNDVNRRADKLHVFIP